MDKRRRLLQKHFPSEHDEEEIVRIEFSIAEMCEEENRKKIVIRVFGKTRRNYFQKLNHP